MKLSACALPALAALVCGLIAGGCLPSSQSQLDEEKEPHFIAGRGRVNAMDYRGAIESFEKALEVNPHSASAHLELGTLYAQNEADPAAAIYHYAHYLKYRPNAYNAEIIRDRILSCKQQLARTVSLGPVTEKQQRDLEKLAEENKRLVEENKKLTDEVTRWKAYYASLPPAATGAPPASAPGVRARDLAPGTNQLRVAQPGPAARTNSPRAEFNPPPVVRVHVVKPGETPATIARQYGVRLDSLLAANPGLEPRRMRAGRTLKIPNP